MPVALRAYLTSNVNLCWLIGQIIGTGVLRALVNDSSDWSYRYAVSKAAGINKETSINCPNTCV